MSKEPNILYFRAHVYLNLEEGPMREDWKDCFKEGRLSKNGLIQMSLNNSHLLEIVGVSIPTDGRHSLITEKEIVASAKRITGDLEGSLERYENLLKMGIVQNNLYFTPKNLLDYSKEKKLRGKRVAEWAAYAKGYTSSLFESIPRSVKGREQMEVKILSEGFQRLQNIETLGTIEGDFNTIEGKTFADRVNNFLEIYDALAAHLKWTEQEERKMAQAGRSQGKCFSPEDIKVAEIIFPTEK